MATDEMLTGRIIGSVYTEGVFFRDESEYIDLRGLTVIESKNHMGGMVGIEFDREAGGPDAFAIHLSPEGALALANMLTVCAKRVQKFMPGKCSLATD